MTRSSWVAVHLPLLSLEAWANTLPVASREGPIALMDVHTVVATNAAAQALGVQAGQRRATALALAPHTVLGRADAARDAQALAAVAHAALAFTPSVTLEPAANRGTPVVLGATSADSRATPAASQATPAASRTTPAASRTTPAASGPTPAAPAVVAHTVLLEVQASLRYFGGLPRLLQRLQTALLPLGHVTRCACAPTPQAAALLARSRIARPLDADVPMIDAATLDATLDDLPTWLLAAGAEQATALGDIGVRTVADLRRLPRAGVAQRYGQALLAEIERALGRQPDPRVWVTAAPTFSSRVELHARADTTEPLLQGATVLVAQLLAWAEAHHALIGGCVLRLRHERHRRHQDIPPVTEIDLALAEPSCDRAHLLLLLRERLARLQLPAPTLELDLLCDRLVHSAPPNLELFATRASERIGLLQLIERLQARLGAEQVQRLAAVQDHRPECANAESTAVPWAVTGRQRPAPVSTSQTTPLTGTVPLPAGRPVWLLPQPEPLAERRSRPVLDGRPLQLLCGPERIESGWWDGALAERDYFIARADDGALVWIYRTRLPLSDKVAAGWFLHGRYA